MTFPFAARTNAPNTRAASMEPLEVLLSTHNPQVDKLLGGGFPCKGFVELLTTGERRGEISLLIHALAHVKRVVWILPPQGFTPYAPAFEAAGIDLSRQLFVVPASPEEAARSRRRPARGVAPRTCLCFSKCCLIRHSPSFACVLTADGRSPCSVFPRA